MQNVNLSQVLSLNKVISDTFPFIIVKLFFLNYQFLLYNALKKRVTWLKFAIRLFQYFNLHVAAKHYKYEIGYNISS